MAKRKGISDSDRNLFRSSVGEVALIKQDQADLGNRKPPPIPLQRHADQQAVIKHIMNSPFVVKDVATGDELFFKRPGIQQRVMEKLRRGQFAIEKELDLHGMTVINAETALKQFLSHCQKNNYRCVRIIHGKGHGSKDKKPVIKNRLNHCLQKNSAILAFCSARPVDGGTGAIYVLIKRTQP
jgi:DNA-nicking Smr family endonuclease